jgi:hypothetical protein
MPEISTWAAATPKAAPTVKRRFEASLARQFLPLGAAARGYAPSTQSGPGGHGVPASLPCTCMGASPPLLVLAGAHARVSPARHPCGVCARRRGAPKVRRPSFVRVADHPGTSREATAVGRRSLSASRSVSATPQLGTARIRGVANLGFSRVASIVGALKVNGLQFFAEP